MARVQALLHDATLGSGSALILAGESGVGKSRLLRECAALRSSAQSIGAYCGASPIAGRDLAAQMAVELRVHLDGSPAAPASILATVAAQTKRKPLALFVDDVQLATAAEIALLDALLSLTGNHRFVLVASINDQPAWSSASAKVHSRRWLDARTDVQRIPPLDDVAMELLVRSLSSATRSLEPSDVREILRTAQGLPRYGIELATDTDSLRSEALVPTSARLAVRTLRDVMSKADFDVLCACSVIGDRFADAWIAPIAERPRTVVANALQNASDLGILAEDPHEPGWLAFRQVAMRRALRASLVSLKRRILHERCAEHLGDLPVERQPHASIAYHFESLGDSKAAGEAFHRAADEQRRAGAFSESAELYERAAVHLPVGSQNWLASQKSLILSYRDLGDWRKLVPAARATVAAMDRVKDAEEAADLLGLLFIGVLIDGAVAEAELVAAEIAALGVPDARERGYIATLIVTYAMCYTGRDDEAARLLAGVDPNELTSDEGKLRYLVAKSEVLALRRPLEESLQIVDEAAALASTFALRGTVIALGAGSELSCRYGNLGKAQEYIDRAAVFANRSPGAYNDRKWRIVKENVRIRVVAGDLLSARELLRSNLDWRESGRHNEAFDAGMGVLIGMRTGDLALVDAFFDPALLYASVDAYDVESCGVLLPGFAEVMQLRGLTKELRTALERCVGYGMVDAYTVIQFAAARFGSPECADRALEQVEAYYRDALAPPGAAHIALCRAAVLRRRGRQVDAGERAREAASRYRQLGWRLFEATALELAGDLRGAGAVYEACGASSDVARLAARQTRKQKRSPFGARLTPRELEVARLVARKRSDQEIARALEISVRTAQHHVEAIFSKLGVRARWQVSQEAFEREAGTR